MGGVRNLSSGVHRKAGGSGVRSARVSKKDTTNQSTRSGTRKVKASTTAAGSKTQEPLVYETFPSVWEALSFSPSESTNLNIRAMLLIRIREIIRENGWKQAVAAKKCGVSQPRINDLMRARLDKFSIDALVNIAWALGWKVDFTLQAA